MLRIRSEQVRAIAPGNASFVDRMLTHAQRYFPRECAGLPEPRLRETIEHGIAKAAGYGIVGQQDVCKLLNLMFSYGRDFDQSPEHAWMRAHLERAGERGATLQVNRLYRRVLARALPPTGLGPMARRAG